MNRNHQARLERLEETAHQWKADNAVYELFDMDNKIIIPSTWTQHEGMKRGEPIKFETPRAALDWVLSNLGDEGQAQIYLDDVRSILDDEERVMFDALFPDAPDYQVMFDIRNGTDVTAEALRLWRHYLRGVKHIEWWEGANARIDGILQSLPAAPM